MEGTMKAPSCIYKTGTISGGSDSLSVQGKVQGSPCRCIIDTGSNITIVRPDVVAKVAKKINIKPVDCYLKTVTGEAAPVVGRATLHFQIGNFETCQEVWLAEITDPCVIGLDFLVRHNCRVDIASATLTVGKMSIPLLRPAAEEQLRCCRVVATQDVEIPPRSEAIIPGTCVGEVTSGWGSVEPRVKLHESRDIDRKSVV